MKYFALSLFLLAFISCKNNTNTDAKDIKEVAREIMVNAKNCALITVDSLGVAHARTMDPFLPEDDFTVWMGTNSKSSKVQQIQYYKNVSLYYFEQETGSYVTLQGGANIVNTKEEKEKYWKNEWKNFYKNRTTDYLLIKFTPNLAHVISEKYTILGDAITWKTPTIQF